MKRLRLLARTLLLLGSVALAPWLRADLEFVGILATPQKTRFALTDPIAEETRWLTLGDVFAGYKLTAYDPATDTLTVTKAGAASPLRLKNDAKIKNARLELTGRITFGPDQSFEIERATLLFDQENVFPLTDGIVYRIKPTRRDDGTIRYHIEMERSLAANKTERLSVPEVTTLPGQPFSIRLGDAGFTFKPR